MGTPPPSPVRFICSLVYSKNGSTLGGFSPEQKFMGLKMKFLSNYFRKISVILSD